MHMQAVLSVLAVAEYRNYAEAAHQVHWSISTVSKHVQSVEQELGVRLFNRGISPDGVTLTDQGVTLLPYLQHMKGSYQKVLDCVEDTVRQNQMSLTIGYVPLLGTVGEVALIAQFQHRYRDANIVHVMQENAQLQQLLLQHKLDGAFFFYLAGAAQAKKLWHGKMAAGLERVTVYHSSKLYVGVSAEHRLAERSSIAIEELEGETFIFNNVNINTTQGGTAEISSALGQIPLQVRYMDFIHRPTVYRMVAQGRGVLPQCCILPDDAQGIRFVPVSNICMNSKAEFIYWSKAMSKAMPQFLELMEARNQKRRSPGGII